MGFCVFTNPTLQDNVVRALRNLFTRKYVEYINRNMVGFEKPKKPMWLTFLCPGDIIYYIYDVRSHNYILKFAEVDDIIMDILNPSKTQNWKFWRFWCHGTVRETSDNMFKPNSEQWCKKLLCNVTFLFGKYKNYARHFSPLSLIKSYTAKSNGCSHSPCSCSDQWHQFLTTHQSFFVKTYIVGQWFLTKKRSVGCSELTSQIWTGARAMAVCVWFKVRKWRKVLGIT